MGRLHIFTDDYSDVDSFKEYLSTAEVEVDYILATITEEIIELPIIPTNKGTSIIEVDTNTKPSNMEVHYYAK